MFVLVNSRRPDRVFENQDNALTHLEDSINDMVYEYIYIHGQWVTGNRYYLIGDREIVYNRAGQWEVPFEYASYNFPNICPNCNRDNFMQGTFCTLCFGYCLDCGNPDTLCQCVYNDY